MLPTKHTKEGVLNEKLALKKLLTYITSVYKIPQKIKCLSDKRKRKSIPLFNIVMPVLLFLMLQYESFHTIFSAPESMSKRLRNVAGEREGSGEMDVAGNSAGTDSPGDLMGDDEPQVGYRRVHDASPTCVPRNIHHRGKNPVQTIGGTFQPSQI